MGFRKAIRYGKEHRKPYRGAKKFDRSCRNHGGCPYCEKGRQHKHERRSPIIIKDQFSECFTFGNTYDSTFLFSKITL